MRPASLAPIALSLCLAAPAFAEPLQLYAVQSRGSQQGPQPNANAEAFNSKIDALFTGSGGLTADEAARRATKTSYDVEAQRQEMLSQEALRLQAKYGFIPTLTASASYLHTRNIVNLFPGQTNPVTGVTGPPTRIPYFANQYSLGLNLSVPLSDYFLRLPQNLAAARQSQEAATYTARHTELTTATNARVSFYEWARAKLQLVVQEQALEQAKAQSKDVRAQFEAGSSTRADVLRLESQVATTELAVEQARAVAQLAEEQLRTAMHDPGKAPYQISEDVRTDIQDMPDADDVTGLWAEAESNRLDLKALDLQARAQHERASAARADYYPRLAATGSLQELNPLAQRFPQQNKWDYWWTVGATLSWTPTNLLTSRQGAESLEHQASKLEAQRNAARDSVHVAVLDAYQRLKVAIIALDTTSRSLASSEESYRVRRALFQNGRATTVEVIDAETDLTRSRQLAVNARIDLRIARARLINAVGRDVDQKM